MIFFVLVSIATSMHHQFNALHSDQESIWRTVWWKLDRRVSCSGRKYCCVCEIIRFLLGRFRDVGIKIRVFFKVFTQGTLFQIIKSVHTQARMHTNTRVNISTQFQHICVCKHLNKNSFFTLSLKHTYSYHETTVSEQPQLKMSHICALASMHIIMSICFIQYVKSCIVGRSIPFQAKFNFAARSLKARSMWTSSILWFVRYSFIWRFALSHSLYLDVVKWRWWTDFAGTFCHYGRRKTQKISIATRRAVFLRVLTKCNLWFMISVLFLPLQFFWNWPFSRSFSKLDAVLVSMHPHPADTTMTPTPWLGRAASHHTLWWTDGRAAVDTAC